MIKLASQGYVQGEVEFQKGSAPPLVLAAQKPVQSKNEFFENKSSGSCGFAPICSTGRQKGSMTAPF
jgi:hypothetical protein